MLENARRDGRLSGTIWTGNDYQNGFMHVVCHIEFDIWLQLHWRLL